MSNGEKMSQIQAPVGSRVERKKNETRQKIISVAMDLFKKQGVGATTMEQIAEEADIAKGTLYNYFPVKEAIIDEYIKQIFKERNAERIQKLQGMPDTRSRMVLILSLLMEGVQAQREIFERYFVYRIQNMISLHQDESMASGLYLLEREIITLGQKTADLRQDLPVDILGDLFEFVFIKVAQQFYRAPEKFNAQEAIDRYVDLFMNGAKNEH
jgi:AcrR family transcriptional regulator